MAARLDTLIPQMQPLAVQLLQACLARGIEMRPNEALRTPFVQARYWRQSRSREQILKKINELRQAGAHFLATCLEVVGPQHGEDVTGAIPGLSWHQWGEALDCFWVVGGEAEWSVSRTINGLNGYRVYAEEARNLGLNAGGFWHSRQDWPHVQLRTAASPLAVHSIQQIDQVMRERFGHLL